MESFELKLDSLCLISVFLPYFSLVLTVPAVILIGAHMPQKLVIETCQYMKVNMDKPGGSFEPQKRNAGVTSTDGCYCIKSLTEHHNIRFFLVVGKNNYVIKHYVWLKCV